MLNDAKTICLNAIASCLPDESVKKALRDLDLKGNIYLVAVGKAAFSMAKAATESVDIVKGIVISKYGHIKGEIDKVECYEAGHPILDQSTINATAKVIEMCKDLKEDDKVLFLLSGGASSLFEKPLVELDELQNINDQMLKKGCSIFEINTIRKKLSMVKGGRFADLCKPAKVYSIILSDVLSDRLDTIGSGPTAKDETDGKEAIRLLDQYQINVNEETRKIIEESKPALTDNSTNIIIGSVKILCQNAMKEAEKLGYKAILLNDQLDCEARQAGDYLYHEIMKHYDDKENIALVMGGETVVHVKGTGKGGRNQELVFSQIEHIKGMNNVLIMSLGSDGTDGPTDAAGGYVDGSSYEKLQKQNLSFEAILDNNDSYYGLKTIDSLIITGPTGTNVNDVCVALIKNS